MNIKHFPPKFHYFTWFIFPPAESKFEFAVINPALVFGPVLCGAPGSTVDIVKRLMERDPGLVPNVSYPVCDVRDVAKAHLMAMTIPEAAGKV